jgi:hypothetical protein
VFKGCFSKAAFVLFLYKRCHYPPARWRREFDKSPDAPGKILLSTSLIRLGAKPELPPFDSVDEFENSNQKIVFFPGHMQHRFSCFFKSCSAAFQLYELLFLFSCLLDLMAGNLTISFFKFLFQIADCHYYPATC